MVELIKFLCNMAVAVFAPEFCSFVWNNELNFGGSLILISPVCFTSFSLFSNLGGVNEECRFRYDEAGGSDIREGCFSICFWFGVFEGLMLTFCCLLVMSGNLILTGCWIGLRRATDFILSLLFRFLFAKEEESWKALETSLRAWREFFDCWLCEGGNGGFWLNCFWCLLWTLEGYFVK